MSNKDNSFVVSGHGFSDKRIKIESLKNHPGITIDGNDFADYLNRTSSKELISELTEEKKSEISICHKPRIRYKDHKENPSVGNKLDRSKINYLYNGKIMQNLKKMNAPQVRYVLAAFLSGETFTYESLHNYIKEKADKTIRLQPLQACLSGIKHSKIGFLFEKIGRLPAHWQLEPRATSMLEEDLYQLFLPRGLMNIEQACNKYPFISEILKEQGIIDTSTLGKRENTEIQKRPDARKNKSKIEKPDQKSVESELVMPVKSENHLKSIFAGSVAETLLEKGKLDINVNFNFRILFK